MNGFEGMYNNYYYEVCDDANYCKQTLAKKTHLKRTRSKRIKVFGSKSTHFSAEDLLNLSLPFGYVISVQKTVRNGHSCGVVTYSNPDDAAKAMANLNSIKGLFVDLDTNEVNETHRDERSEYPYDQSSRLPQDRFRGPPPQGVPCWDFRRPLYKQHVNLHIYNFPKLPYQRERVYSFLPQSTIKVKVEKRSALVTLPDYYTAFWVMDHLNGYLIGSKRLCVSFATERARTGSSTKPAHRRGF